MKKLVLFFLNIVLIGLIVYLSPIYFGSYTDFINQHAVFPEYFRNLFYETLDLFPSFAFNIGGGQNIYNFAYYGLLSPFTLLSYLFPNIEMTTFLTIINILIFEVSGFLFYRFLRRHFNKDISLITTILFLLAGPFFFQLHRHFMFVNYMPFLILALEGVEDYFNEHKQLKLIINVALIILTSFYYSVGALLVIGIYALYYYLKEKNAWSFKAFKIVFPLVIAIILTAFLLIPTFFTLLGDSSRQTLVSFKDLFFFDFSLDRILYGNYNLGLTALFILAFIYLLFEKNLANYFLFLALLLAFFLPLPTYILNGALYFRTKVLIPFLPLVYYIIAKALKGILNRQYDFWKMAVLVVAVSTFFYFFGKQEIYYFLDIGLLILLIFGYFKYHKKYLLFIGILIVPLCLFISLNFNEHYVSKEEYDDYFLMGETLTNNITTNDKTYYRLNYLASQDRSMNKVFNMSHFQTSLYSSVYNPYYKNFVYDVNETSLPYRNNLMQVSVSDYFMEMLMGVKYVITKSDLALGYEKVLEENGYKVYKNLNAFSIGYAKDINESMNIEDFNKLNLAEKKLALVTKTIGDMPSSSFEPIEPSQLNYKLSSASDDITITSNDDAYLVEVKKDSQITVTGDKLNNQILIISFDVLNDSSCSNGDLKIKINGVGNNLTCKSWTYYNNNHTFNYVLTNNLDNLKIEFSKGKYEIANLKYYLIDYSKILAIKNLAPLEVTYLKNDKLKGHIAVNSDAYFTLTIPYDKDFEIKVNGKKVKYERVNGSFIGFPLVKGSYDIEVTYKATYQKIGMVVSFGGLILLLMTQRSEKNGKSYFRRLKQRKD